MNHQYTVCFLFSKELDKVLLLTKNKTTYKGRLNGTGGKIEQNESPEACARREIYEETSLIMENGTLHWIGTLQLPDDCARPDEKQPGCTLCYFCGIIPEGQFPKAPEGGEELCMASVAEVLAAPVTSTKYAGEGDLQYFVRKSIDKLMEKNELRLVHVRRSGFAFIEAKSNDDAKEKARNLPDSEFAWSENDIDVVIGSEDLVRLMQPVQERHYTMRAPKTTGTD